MAEPTRKLSRRLAETLDGLGVNPLGLLVFLASAAALAALHVSTVSVVTVPAVGRATAVAHPAPVTGIVAVVHVEPGTDVVAGTPLVTLTAESLERELARLDAEIRRTIREGQLEQAKIHDRMSAREQEVRLRLAEARRGTVRARAAAERQAAELEQAETRRERVAQQVEAQVLSAEEQVQADERLARERAGTQQTRQMLDGELAFISRLRQELSEEEAGGSLSRAVMDLYEAELELLRVQREQISTDLAQLTVVATTSGRVDSVVGRGADVSLGASVARVVPPRAEEVVAYLPPDTHPEALDFSGEVQIAFAANLLCEGQFESRPGASVGPMPLALSPSGATAGLPVHIRLPDQCHVGVGQVVTVTVDGP